MDDCDSIGGGLESYLVKTELKECSPDIDINIDMKVEFHTVMLEPPHPPPNTNGLASSAKSHSAEQSSSQLPIHVQGEGSAAQA